jgi:hypothetical protein
VINLQGVRRTIADIKQNGENMEDLHDLAMLYQLEERMMREAYSEDAGDEMELSRDDAETWVAALQSEDTAKPRGAKWTRDQVRPYAQKYGYSTEGAKLYEFWAVMNALYADYCDVAKRYNVATPDFFADMTKAFLQDKDAMSGKAARYFASIVKK